MEEMFGYTVSNDLSTSMLVIASLFSEKTCFNPGGNVDCISDQPLPYTISSAANVCWAVEGSEGGKCSDSTSLFILHEDVAETWWWYLETPLNTPI